MGITLKPLKNIKILDLTRLIPGPFATKILADLGAEVIKIEDMGKGDYVNLFPPQVFGEESALGVYFHKNKQRLKVDFTQDEGRDIILKLAKKADVLIESYRPGRMQTWGLDFAKVRKVAPKLIYVSLTGFGQQGALANRAGHDLNFLAVSGMLPLFDKVPKYQIADFVAGGTFAAFLIQSALMERLKTKKGRYLDIAMTEALTYLSQHMHFAPQGLQMGIVQGLLARYQIYETSDNRRMAFGALEDKFWHKFCDLMNRPDWKTAGFEASRNASITQELRREFATKPASYWKKFGDDNDLCLMVESDRGDLRNLGLLKPIDVSCEGTTSRFEEGAFLGFAPKQSYFKAGHHNATILKNLGYNPKTIAELKAKGVVA